MNEKSRLKLLVINAIADSSYNSLRKEIFSRYLRADSELDVVSLPSGTPTLEFFLQEMENALEVVKIIKNAEEKYYKKGVLINCFLDPGLEEAKECVKIPVIGAGHTAMNYAAMMCHKFAIITPGKKMVPRVEKKVISYNLERKVSDIFPMKAAVTKLQKREVDSDFIEEVSSLVKNAEKRGAEMIVFACTAVIGLLNEIQPYVDLPLLDPSIISLKILEAVADIYNLTGLAQSKVLTYSPPDKIPPFLK